MSLLQSLGLEPKAKVCESTATSFSTRLRQKLAAAEYAQCELLLINATDENRECMIYGASGSENAVAHAAKWVMNAPDSAMAHVLLGASMIAAGWEIRGDIYAKDVDDSAWQPFMAKLTGAEEPLLRAIALDPRSAEAHSWLITAGRGQGRDLAALRNIFDLAIARTPLHWASHFAFFKATTEKWCGSHKEMFKFVRNVSQGAPRGHVLHCLIPAAYCDYALAVRSEKGCKAISPALKHSKFADEVVHALYAWLNATSDNLQDKLLAVSGGFASYGVNHFAVALYLCGAKKEARAVLSALSGQIDEMPWRWISDGIREGLNPAFVYDRACRELGVVIA